MERTLVVGDAHGQHRIVRRLLEEAGVLGRDGLRLRQPGTTVVQVGDLINATGDTRRDDAMILRRAHAWFDILLFGNHEYPYLGGYGFGGFEADAEVGRLLDRHVWLPAFPVGDTLLTHAGVSALIGVQSASARDAAVEIGEAWLADPQHPFFAACSPARPGGKDSASGILWKDWSEPRSLAFSQVHGHTPLRDGPVFVGNPEGVFVGNVDVGARGGRVGAVWLDRDGRPVGDVLVAALDSTPSAGSERIAS